MLFENVGKKIQVLAKVVFIVGLVLNIFICLIPIIMDSNDVANLINAVITLICGPILLLCSAWVLYGFGVIVSNAELSSIQTQDMIDDGEFANDTVATADENNQ